MDWGAASIIGIVLIFINLAGAILSVFINWQFIYNKYNRLNHLLWNFFIICFFFSINYINSVDQSHVIH
jgi:hypothetical protein